MNYCHEYTSLHKWRNGYLGCVRAFFNSGLAKGILDYHISTKIILYTTPDPVYEVQIGSNYFYGLPFYAGLDVRLSTTHLTTQVLHVR